MIRDMYSRSPDVANYNSGTLEVSDKLSQLVLKIENVLFTRKGDILGSPGMGCNLDELVFSIVLNESTIQNTINAQIAAFCLPDESGFTVTTKVQFFSLPERNGALVDIAVNGQRVLGALF
jgi:hypothetical protein